MMFRIPSLRPSLTMCLQTIMKIEDVIAICRASGEEWEHIRDRTASALQNEVLRSHLYRSGGDLGNLITNIHKEVELLGASTELENPADDWKISPQLQAAWKRHITIEQQDTFQILAWASETLGMLNRWHAALEVLEDAGSTSSYSDYSGDDTDTTDENEEEDGSTASTVEED